MERGIKGEKQVGERKRVRRREGAERGQKRDREGKERGERGERERENGRGIQLEIENQPATLKGCIFHYCK